MNIEESLLLLFERTLDSTQDDHLQTILASQAKIIQQKKENVVPQTTAIHKKLYALEKNFIQQSSFKKRRRSKYEHRSNTGSQCDQSQTIINDDDTQEIHETEQQKLRRENQKLQEKITKLEYLEREKYLQNCNEIERINKEKQQIIENQKKLEEKQRQLNSRQNTLQQKQKNLIKQEEQCKFQKIILDENTQEQSRYDDQLEQRRIQMEKLQIKLNNFISQLLSSSRSKNKTAIQLNVQIDAIEQLTQFVLNDRSLITQEQQYLRSFKEKVLEEKRDFLKMKEQIK